jgi:hypothetical protein
MVPVEAVGAASQLAEPDPDADAITTVKIDCAMMARIGE